MQGLTISGLDKSYGSARVLRDVSLALRPGEVHALMGENGAGKSTLIKALAGVIEVDAMTVKVDGAERKLDGPADAAALGLRFLHQELNIVPALSVAENILMSRRTPRRFGGLVDWPIQRARAADALARFGATHIDPDARAGSLSTGDRMLAVLAGLLAADDTAPSVFVMDEPTAALTQAEADRLFAVIADLRRQGAAILYVSHRLAEVMAVADQVTVLRDGTVALSGSVADTSKDQIIEAMTGQAVTDAYPQRPPQTAPGREVTLDVVDLSPGPVEDVTFSLRRGEILGIVGLEGAGQSDILRTILGDTTPRRGRVTLGGEAGPRSAAEAWRRGIAYVPRERRREGLMLGRAITPNVVLPHLGRLSALGLWSRGRAERAEAETRGRSVRLKYDRLSQSAGTLSGGNQQKVVFARAVAGTPRLVLLDDPTRGVDVGARADIYRMIRRLSSAGTSVLMTSSDLPELIGMCDRIVILNGGRQTGIVEAEGLTPARLQAMIQDDATRKAMAS
jgi:ribose transport system ATP-binding protein